MPKELNHCPIRGISLSNFKAFGASPVRIPIKPITLVFGPNSGGKSSILHSLLWAHHSICKGELDVNRPANAGSSIDLGGWNSFKRSGAGEMRWSFEMAPADVLDLPVKINQIRLNYVVEESRGPFGSSRFEIINQGVWDPSLSKRYGISLGYSGGGASEEDPESRFFSESFDHNSASPNLAKIEIEIDGITAFRFRGDSFDDDDDRCLLCDHLEFTHPVISAYLETKGVKLPSQLEVRQLEFLVGGDGLKIECRPSNSCLIEDTPELNDLRKHLADFLTPILRLVVQYDNAFRYLGPLRMIPERDLPTEKSMSEGDWDADGSHLWKMLSDSPISLGKQVSDWLSATQGVPQYRVVADIPIMSESIMARYQEFSGFVHNGGLKEFIKGKIGFLLGGSDEGDPYPLCKDNLLIAFEMTTGNDPPDDKELAEYCAHMALVPDAAAELQELEFEQWLDHLVERRMEPAFVAREFRQYLLRKDGSHTDPVVYLADSRSGRRASLRDVGVGVSQLLPILVEAAASKKSLITIEQPELHLHPAMQSELADVFIESALGNRRNRFLLETHSEHLILRLLRRIRETTRGTLPDGMNPVRPEDVAVIYVEPGEEGSIVRELRINDQGRFIDDWPNGFFEERFNEEF